MFSSPPMDDIIRQVKPCPFCGEIGRWGPDGAYYFFHEEECWIKRQKGLMLDCVTPTEIKSWNQRFEGKK